MSPGTLTEASSSGSSSSSSSGTGAGSGTDGGGTGVADSAPGDGRSSAAGVSHSSSHTPATASLVPAAFVFLKTLFDVHAFLGHAAPVVMQHQLYALIQNRTEVDRWIDRMKARGILRAFKLGIGMDEFALVQMSDYVEQAQRSASGGGEIARLVAEFVEKVAKQVVDVSIGRAELEERHGLSEQDVRELVRCGLLLVRGETSYWIALPGAGHYIESLRKGRSDLIKAIQRSKYK